MASFGVSGGLLYGLVLLSSGCGGQQSLQGCTPPGLRNQPPTISATSVGSVGFTTGGSPSIFPTTTITITFGQPMDPHTLKGTGDDPSKATILVEECSGFGGQCTDSISLTGKVTYEPCSATATLTLAQRLRGGSAPGIQHVLAIPACTTPSALCSNLTLARDTNTPVGNPITTAFTPFGCGRLSNVLCVNFLVFSGG